jgi:5-methylcytosine-specific restriction endonuclease McrA
MKSCAVIAAALACAVFTGCGSAAAQVPVGPGPTNYVVEPQPPAGSCHYRTAANSQVLPDPACTPGATNPKVTQDTVDTTICRRGYTKSIRPPAAVTEAEKRGNAAAYGYSGPLSDAEFDHLVPLSLGGDPNDPRNLWVEPGASPNPKDDIEVRLAQMVCARKVSLAAAQEAIANDWTTALSAVG